MPMPTEADVVVAPTETDASESIHAGYDRIANPEKAQDEPKIEPVKPTEQPTATVEATASSDAPQTFTADQMQEIMANLSRIPKMEKQLNDTGGRYGALKQSLEQLQQRITAPTAGDPVDVEDMLAGIKEEFGEDGLYTSLKSAFSKLAAGKTIDPGAVAKMVSEQVAATKQAEVQDAMAQLTESHPTWMQDRETPEFKEWKASLPDKVRSKLDRTYDTDYVSDRLDEFKEWKAKKSAAPAIIPPTTIPKPTGPSKRLTSAVLPTNGTKPKTAGEDDKQTSIRAGYERVAGARMR